MHVFRFTCLVTAVSFCVACSTAPRATDDSSLDAPPAAASSDTLESTQLDDRGARLVVHGMSCPKCVSNIDLMLKRVPGVSNVAINMRDGFVDVDFASGAKPNPLALAKAVNDAGLTLVRIEAAP